MQFPSIPRLSGGDRKIERKRKERGGERERGEGEGERINGGANKEGCSLFCHVKGVYENTPVPLPSPLFHKSKVILVQKAIGRS